MRKLLVLLFFLSLTATNVYAQQFGVITETMGKVTIFSARRKAWRPARLKQKLTVKDRVKTGDESRVEIKCANGGVVRIAENTELQLASLTKAGGSEVTLQKGKVWMNMKKIITKKRRFKVTTPTASAAIRGTVFRVDAGQDSSADVLVYEGKVAVGPGAELQQQINNEKEGRHEVAGPQEVAGPTEVSLETWISIVAGMQISVRKDGSYEKFQFDQAQDRMNEWVKYNLEKDKKLEN